MHEGGAGESNWSGGGGGGHHHSSGGSGRDQYRGNSLAWPASPIRIFFVGVLVGAGLVTTVVVHSHLHR